MNQKGKKKLFVLMFENWRYFFTINYFTSTKNHKRSYDIGKRYKPPSNKTYL